MTGVTLGGSRSCEMPHAWFRRNLLSWCCVVLDIRKTFAPTQEGLLKHVIRKFRSSESAHDVPREQSGECSIVRRQEQLLPEVQAIRDQPNVNDRGIVED